MTRDVSLSTVQQIMTEFADRTGLSSKKTPRRYLWTDAFAVCNFLELYRQTGEERYRKLALDLVYSVHHVLGRHREDDPRAGWLSGLDEQEGEDHPTKGGLRIGKELNERKPEEPFDWDLEWRRDGQYYHYLTKWMHALSRVGRSTENPIYNRWALELAKTAHSAFTYKSSSGRRLMYWKMSIDLSRPLVSSMGQHDPLDGLITYLELQWSARKDRGWPSIEAEIAEMDGICGEREWGTDDPLGIGELLCNAYKVAQLVDAYPERSEMLHVLLDSSEAGLDSYLAGAPLEFPAAYRIPFRELGLSIGLKAVERLRKLIKPHPFVGEDLLAQRVKKLLQDAPLGKEIERFWLENRETKSWVEHLDINEVMLATSLAPDEYLRI